jgi:hypothetical protein
MEDRSHNLSSDFPLCFLALVPLATQFVFVIARCGSKEVVLWFANLLAHLA